MKKIDHAPHAKEFALLSIFRPGRGKNLDFVKEIPGGMVEVKSADRIGEKEQTLFFYVLALCALEKRDRKLIPANSKGAITRKLREELAVDFSPLMASQDIQFIRTTIPALAKNLDLSKCGETWIRIRNSLNKLFRISFLFILSNGEEWPSKLISWHKDKNGTIRIAINPLSAAAILGNYVRIDLRERAMLRGDYAKIGHAWLCGWISPGRKGKISTNKLALNVWGEEAESGSVEVRKRRMKIRNLMQQLQEIGWVVSEKSPNLFEIFRPKGEGFGTEGVRVSDQTREVFGTKG